MILYKQIMIKSQNKENIEEIKMIKVSNGEQYI